MDVARVLARTLPAFDTSSSHAEQVSLTDSLIGHSTIKAELIQERRWCGRNELRSAVFEYIEVFYRYFVDPDGFRWEVAFNPHPIGDMQLP